MSANRNPRRSLLLEWLGLVAVESFCQIAIKCSARDTGPLAMSAGSLVIVFRSPWFWAALFCYLAGFLLWMLILRRSSLSSAFPTSALVFVTSIAASVAILEETLNTTQMVGATVIVIGILLLGPDKPEPQHATSINAQIEDPGDQ